MTDILKAPGVQHYIDWLHRSGNGAFNKGVTYDGKSYPLIDKVYDELRKIAPMGNRNLRELWLRADRGTIEALGNMEDLLEYGDFENEAEVEAYWKDMYPDDEYWYFMQSIEDEDTGYRAIFLAHKFVVDVDPRAAYKTFPHDISEFMEWMLSEVKRCVAELEAGTYNDNIRNNLPARHRTGTIVRKELYDVFPEEREEFFADLSKEDREILAIVGLCILLPVGINSVALMGSEVIYTLMVLAFFLWMCLPLVLWDMAGSDNGYSKREKVFGKLIASVVVVMIFLNSYFANVNHTALYYANCRVKSAVESIVVQAYQQEGYNTGKKWAFIGNASDKAFYPLDWGTGYLYDGNPKPSTLMNAYSRGKWFQIYLSRPITQQANASEQKKLMELPEVVAMPTWPDDGSVKVVGDYIVVKFSK